jgi:ABC-type multidrug transport system ATPase subunit
MSEMSQTADQLLVIGRGRIIAAGTVQQVIDSVAGGAVRVRSPRAGELNVFSSPATCCWSVRTKSDWRLRGCLGIHTIRVAVGHLLRQIPRNGNELAQLGTHTLLECRTGPVPRASRTYTRSPWQCRT